MVNVFVSDISELNISKDLSMYESILSQERVDKVAVKSQKKARQQSLGAGLLLRYGLKQLYQIEEKDAEVFYGEQGKPSIQGVHFNISHSGKYAVCAFADAEIGVDIEEIRDAKLKVAKRFFTEAEYTFLQREDTTDQNEDFYRLWTAKESFLKVTGQGMKLPMNTFEIDLEKEMKVIQSIDTNEYYLKEKVLDNYCIALCKAEKDFSVEYTKVLAKTLVL